MKQFDLGDGNTCTATYLEPMKGVVVGSGGGEAEIENNRYHLQQQLHEAYTTVFTSPFWYQDHHLPPM